MAMMYREFAYSQPDRHEWEVPGETFVVPSDSNPHQSYTVTVRNDTQNGGTYLHCTCPSWPRSIAKGGCKHVIRVRGGRAGTVPSIIQKPDPASPVAAAIAMQGTVSPSDADREAAARLMSIPEDRLAAAVGLVTTTVWTEPDTDLLAEIRRTADKNMKAGLGESYVCNQGEAWNEGPEETGKPNGSYYCERDPDHKGQHAWDNDGTIVRWDR